MEKVHHKRRNSSWPYLEFQSSCYLQLTGFLMNRTVETPYVWGMNYGNLQQTWHSEALATASKCWLPLLTQLTEHPLHYEHNYKW